LQLFYLMSRGLSRKQAERLIVRGFFQPVLDRIGSDEVRAVLAAELELRMGSDSDG
jgi:Fe-S cluster assembly protein SufD